MEICDERSSHAAEKNSTTDGHRWTRIFRPDFLPDTRWGIPAETLRPGLSVV